MRVHMLFFINVCVFIISVCGQSFKIPNVKIEILKPNGLRASISDAPGINLFVFQGHVNRHLNRNDIGSLSGEVTTPQNGRWVYEDKNVKLKEGDVINYYVYVSKDGTGYIRDDLNYTVSQEVSGSVTLYKGKEKYKSGDVIFFDDFLTLNPDVWRVEHQIPVHHLEFPFISYQRSSVTIEDGCLVIRPTLQQEMDGFDKDAMFSKPLNLKDGCTGVLLNSCEFRPDGANILPPVASGKVLSKGLSFQYGVVEIKAKLPQGDWLYPEIMLEPFLNHYGSLNYASGLLKIISARGNRELSDSDTKSDFSNKVIYGGPILNAACRDSLMKKFVGTKMWGDDFHVYSLRWSPDDLSFSVDGTEWATVVPTSKGLYDLLPNYGTCHETNLNVSKMTPFDQEFVLSLGVAVGGITEFKDGLKSGGKPKPWTNKASKAKFNFWQDLHSWYPTWNKPALIIDYVKITAL